MSQSRRDICAAAPVGQEGPLQSPGYRAITMEREMTSRYFENGAFEPCPIRDVLDRIGDRWSLLVMWSLIDGPLRFSALRRRIGDISQRMLAKTVRRLEQDGFIVRTVTPTVPPRVDYDLSPLGRSFLEPLNALIDWADGHHREIRAARAAYVAPTATPAA
jgi:DNA-binding HxlR family transcriptional regulator